MSVPRSQSKWSEDSEYLEYETPKKNEDKEAVNRYRPIDREDYYRRELYQDDER